MMEITVVIFRLFFLFFFFSSRRRHTRCSRDWSSDVCSSDLFAVGSSGLSVRNMRGHIATLPAAAAGAFPLGGTFAANDTNEVRLTGDTLRDSTAWAAAIPWVVLEPVLIEGPRQPVLSIPAGVTIPFGYGAAFVVGNNGPGGLRVGSDGGAAVRLVPRSGTWAGVAFYPSALASSVTNATPAQ